MANQDVFQKAFDEGISCLKHKNNVRKNIMEVSCRNLSEILYIDVETPEVLMLKIQMNRRIELSLVRSRSNTGRVEGTVIHIRALTGQVVYQRSFKSDKYYKTSFEVRYGDVVRLSGLACLQ